MRLYTMKYHTRAIVRGWYNSRSIVLTPSRGVIFL